jgi:hypothetical protein
MMLFSRLDNFEINLRFVSIEIKMMDKFKMAARYELAIIQLVFMLIELKFWVSKLFFFLLFPKLQKIRSML